MKSWLVLLCKTTIVLQVSLHVMIYYNRNYSAILATLQITLYALGV